jgi:hypothetical protein
LDTALPKDGTKTKALFWGYTQPLAPQRIRGEGLEEFMEVALIRYGTINNLIYNG